LISSFIATDDEGNLNALERNARHEHNLGEQRPAFEICSELRFNAAGAQRTPAAPRLEKDKHSNQRHCERKPAHVRDEKDCGKQKQHRGDSAREPSARVNIRSKEFFHRSFDCMVVSSRPSNKETQYTIGIQEYKFSRAERFPRPARKFNRVFCIGVDAPGLRPNGQ
jgi:hypothetical protein